MPIEFHVESIGDNRNDGPAGECGIRVVGKDGELRSRLLLHCVEAHTHKIACAKALLDAPLMPDGVTLSEVEVEKEVAVKEDVEVVDEKTNEKLKKTVVVTKKVKEMVEVRTPNPKISPRVVIERHLAALRAQADKIASASSRHAVESSEDNRLS